MSAALVQTNPGVDLTPMGLHEELLDTGASLGRFCLQGLLGSGAMGQVFASECPLSGREVAVKVPSTLLLHCGLTRRRFHREARCLARARHPNVVSLLESGEMDAWGTPYLVLERLEGETLATLLGRRKQLGALEAATLLLPVLDALAVVHAAGIVHRDLKPGNVMLVKGAAGSVRPVLIDFGLAIIPSEDDLDPEEKGQVAGTPVYLAPEQARGELVDARADVWSMGVTLFHMLAGRPPEVSDGVLGLIAHIATRPPTRIETLCPNVPPALAKVLHRAMAFEPADRYADASEFARALRGFVELGEPLPLSWWASSPAPKAASLPREPWGASRPSASAASRLLEAGALGLYALVAALAFVTAVGLRGRDGAWRVDGGTPARRDGVVQLAAASSEAQESPASPVAIAGIESCARDVVVATAPARSAHTSRSASCLTRSPAVLSPARIVARER